MKVKLIQGGCALQVLYKNGTPIKSGVPVTYYNGKTYVPLRAFVDALDGRILSHNGTIFVYTVDAKILNDTKSQDLSVARTAVCQLKRHYFVNLSLQYREGLFEPTVGRNYYLFPEGEVNRFFTSDGNYNSLTFYEVKDGVAWVTWKCQFNEKAKTKEKDGNTVTKLFSGEITKEVGTRPIINKRIYDFWLSDMSLQYMYGYTEPDGTSTQLEDTNLSKLIGKLTNVMYITKIPNEKRTK